MPQMLPDAVLELSTRPSADNPLCPPLLSPVQQRSFLLLNSCEV